MANSARFEGRTPNRPSARSAWRDGYFESVWWLKSCHIVDFGNNGSSPILANLSACDIDLRQFGINGCRNAWIVKPSGKSRGRGIKAGLVKFCWKLAVSVCDAFRHVFPYLHDSLFFICSLSFPKRSAVFGFKHVLSIDVLNIPWTVWVCSCSELPLSFAASQLCWCGV